MKNMKLPPLTCSKKDIVTLAAAIEKIIVGDLGGSVPVEKIKTAQLREVARKINSVLSIMRRRITDERMAEGAEIFRRKKLQLEIENFSRTIKAIAHGDLAQEAEVARGGELESLENSFNIMTSELNRLREEAAKSRVQSLVESLSDGVIMFDAEQRVTLLNSAAKKMAQKAQLKDEVFEVMRLFAFAEEEAPLTRKDFNERIATMLRTGKRARIGEASLGPIILEIAVIPVYESEKNIIGGALILQDITHINQIAKMKTEFISIVSHQLRTPINEITWNIEMLLIDKDRHLDEKQRENLEEVYNGSKRMLQLVNDLLSVSGLETGQIAMKLWPVQLEESVSAVIADVDSLTRSKKCEIIFTKPEKKLPKISLDPNLMRHVIYNLLDNAITYSALANSPKVFVTLKKNKEAVVLSVKDSGIGIAPEEKSRVFEKFFRGKDARKVVPDGSGLGLYTVKMIVELFGGAVGVEAKKNQGATFSVTLPFFGSDDSVRKN